MFRVFAPPGRAGGSLQPDQGHRTVDDTWFETTYHSLQHMAAGAGEFSPIGRGKAFILDGGLEELE